MAPFQPPPKLAHFAPLSRLSCGVRNDCRALHHLFPDGDADAHLLVAIPSGRFCYLEQLVDERFLVLNLRQLRHQMGDSETRRDGDAPEVDSVFPGTYPGRVYRRQCMEHHRRYHQSPDVSISVLKKPFKGSKPLGVSSLNMEHRRHHAQEITP